jgi:hypothetical protein
MILVDLCSLKLFYEETNNEASHYVLLFVLLFRPILLFVCIGLS